MDLSYFLKLMNYLNDTLKQKDNKPQHTTSYIKHLAVSELSNVLARIKFCCNLKGNRFEMPNVSYT